MNDEDSVGSSQSEEINLQQQNNESEPNASTVQLDVKLQTWEKTQTKSLNEKLRTSKKQTFTFLKSVPVNITGTSSKRSNKDPDSHNSKNHKIAKTN